MSSFRFLLRSFFSSKEMIQPQPITYHTAGWRFWHTCNWPLVDEFPPSPCRSSCGFKVSLGQSQAHQCHGSSKRPCQMLHQRLFPCWCAETSFRSVFFSCEECICSTCKGFIETLLMLLSSGETLCQWPCHPSRAARNASSSPTTHIFP